MKIIILGGGISGLAAAWYCRRQYPEGEITLLEKQKRLGGWIQTKRNGGFLFEEGPRTFPWLRSPHLCQLLGELGLENEIILSCPDAKKRYLWHKNKLRSLSSLVPRFLPRLLLSKFIDDPVGDVSIYDYAKQKFGEKIADTFFDPLVLGIYGGNIKKLSFSSCFPEGPSMPKSGPLFTLKGGMHRLIDELQKQLQIEIVTDCVIEELHPQGVMANGRFWKGERIFSALPPDVLGKISDVRFDVPMLSLWRVFLAYPTPVLPKKGFGYLIPTQEGEQTMGMVWDSMVFPEQNLSTETRITAMLREGTEDPIRTTLSAAERHLGIKQKPIYAAQLKAENAIPQFEVGYRSKLEEWQKEMAFHFPKLTLVGNYLQGPSVEACIRCAKEAVQ